MCRAHATVRGLTRELIEGELEGHDVVLDLEAGLEHMSRGTPRHVDVLLAVVEPYYRSLETGRRVVDLARELNVPDARVVANKVRNPGDEAAIREYCEGHGMEILELIPYDDSLIEAERRDEAPIDADPDGPAVSAVRRVAERLVEGAAARS